MKLGKTPARAGAVKLRPHLIPWYGWRRDRIDRRDHPFRATVSHLPEVMDLRPHCPPVMDQGALGSCTAHGITGVIRYAIMQAKHSDVPLARLQLYYDERFIEGTVKRDAGAEIRDGIKSAAKVGVAPESLWPYDIKKFRSKPPKKVYAAAVQFEALEYQRVGNADGTARAQDIKAAIASGFPVVGGFNVFAQFESDQCARDGIVAMPSAHENPIGGHCVYFVGYGQKSGYITARNSWASDWGDNGDFYVPQAYIEQQGSDFWVIKKVRTART